MAQAEQVTVLEKLAGAGINVDPDKIGKLPREAFIGIKEILRRQFIGDLDRIYQSGAERRLGVRLKKIPVATRLVVDFGNGDQLSAYVSRYNEKLGRLTCWFGDNKKRHVAAEHIILIDSKAPKPPLDAELRIPQTLPRLKLQVHYLREFGLENALEVVAGVKENLALDQELLRSDDVFEEEKEALQKGIKTQMDLLTVAESVLKEMGDAALTADESDPDLGDDEDDVESEDGGE